MKITFDTKSDAVKYGCKTFDDLDAEKKKVVENKLRKFLKENTNLSDYEEGCMWMSYRYCIGRSSIASHMHANEIWKNCKGRMSNERMLFTAFDVNREIEQQLAFGHNFPSFYFPSTSFNRIYTTAVDIVCNFIEQFDIKSEEELCEYKDVHIILSDNEEGYKFEVTTWEEWLRPQVHNIVCNYYGDKDKISEDYAWEFFKKWENKEQVVDILSEQFRYLTKNMPNIELCHMHDFENLFVWNDLAHCFDYEHHHKSVLTDGTECEWFWSYTNKTEQKEDGCWYNVFGYKKIRVPVEKWDGIVTTYLPDSSIKENIY